ncbi:MAG: ribosome biogenesis GTP-binding protein YihA/YsxC [Eubacteriales bacterium]|nr:ribosome biogenesis GTP-binding protein YihA/YsxC [Eubacteriales bacterium]MDD4716818.1 ribosome biogenesis GTP-binding protein YihA/YsxC [Eubacteriales bacterium]
MEVNFRKTVFMSVAADISQAPNFQGPEIVVVGRSNAGKSSFVNALSDNRNMAKVSSKPGKTRNVIYFLIDSKLLLADLPGYGYSAASKTESERYSNFADKYLTSDRRFSLIIHCMDIRHEPSQDDVIMTQWVRSNILPCIYILTKSDKLSSAAIRLRTREFIKTLGINDESTIFSLGNKHGIDSIRKKIANIV